MNKDVMTQSFIELLQQAYAIAAALQHATLQATHVLSASLKNEFMLACFKSSGIDIEHIITIINEEYKKLPSNTGSTIVPDNSFNALLTQCEKESKILKDKYISLAACLLAIATTSVFPTTIQTFLQNNFPYKNVKSWIDQSRKGRTVQDQGAEQEYQVLDKYCHDLTKSAKDGKLDPVIGRNEEIRRIIQILSRRTKNNPVLVGDPGVGKTAIVEGIAQRIIDNDVPDGIRNKRVLSLDMGALIAGTKFRGEFEDRLKQILKAIEEEADGIILFIDEMHMLVGAGGGEGGMDASNLLKPALARGLLHCIGATTVVEYKKYIEKDAALERRFQKVLIEEPSIQDAISILRGLKERYELHHGLRIKDQAIVKAVQLSARMIPERFLPDKAIDLIDEAASMIKMRMDSKPEEIDHIDRNIRQLEIERHALEKESDALSKQRLQDLEQELATLKEKHQILMHTWNAERKPLEDIQKIKSQIDDAKIAFAQAERVGDFGKASMIKYGKLNELEQNLQNAQNKLQQLNAHLIKEEVDEDDIAAVLSRWIKIPVERLKADEGQKLLQMETMLRQRVVGQDEAITKISNVIRVHRAGIADPNKPIGSFLFLGPTGVGKTEVARTLADYLFNDQHKMVRIDMSEYMEKHAVARLIGAPPGYVGYEEGGQLTEAVRRNPYSVILFDEIEKAHSDVFNLFLSLLDEGHLTDSQGRTVSFKNCIIIMTSNIGSDLILKEKAITQQVRDAINDRLFKYFKPEFLNRIDEIVFFKSLMQSDMLHIITIQLKNLEDRMTEKNITLTITDAAMAQLAIFGYNPEFGARPLKRIIQSLVVNPLAIEILQDQNKKHFTIDIAGKDIVIT